MSSQLHRTPAKSPTAAGPTATPATETTATTTSTNSPFVSIGNAATKDRLSLGAVERSNSASTSAMHGDLDWLSNWLNEGPKTPSGIQTDSMVLPGVEVSAGKEGETDNARGEVNTTVTADSSGVRATGTARGEADVNGVRLHGNTELSGDETGLTGSATVGADKRFDNGVGVRASATGRTGPSGLSGSASVAADKRFDNGVVVGATGELKTTPDGVTPTGTARVAHEGESHGVRHSVGLEHRTDRGTAATASATHSGDHHDLTGTARIDNKGAAAALNGRLKADTQVGDTTLEGSVGGTLDTRTGAKADAKATFRNGNTTGSLSADTSGRVRAEIGSKDSVAWMEGEGWRVGAAEGGMTLGGERSKDGVRLDAEANLALIAAEAKVRGEKDLLTLDEYTATVDGSTRAVVEARAQAKGSAKADKTGAGVEGSLDLFAGAKAEAEIGGTLNWDRDDYTEDLKDFADILPGDWDDRMLDQIPDNVWRSASEILFGKGRTPLARAAIALDARAGAGAEAKGTLKTTNGGLMEAEAGVGAAVGVGAGVKTRFGINPLDLIRQGAVKGMEQANVLVGTVEGWLRKLRGKE